MNNKRFPVGIIENECGDLSLLFADETQEEIDNFSKGTKIFHACIFNQASENFEPFVCTNFEKISIYKKLLNNYLSGREENEEDK